MEDHYKFIINAIKRGRIVPFLGSDINLCDRPITCNRELEPWKPDCPYTPSGKELAAVLQALEVSESTFDRWRRQYGGMKSEEAKRLKELEDENKRLKRLVADQALDIQMLKHITEGNW